MLALGLVYAEHGQQISSYLQTALQKATEAGQPAEVVQHGACLGLGVASMGSRSEPVFDLLQNCLYTDNAVAGEAAGLAMGLVMVGSANGSALDKMLAYAHETQHEKIIRGLAMGIALMMYGREAEADALIDQLAMDKDAILRYGAMYTIGLAYAGTSHDAAIRRLLHVAVSDVSDDVRRAAVTAIGFVLLRQPDETPRMVQLLAASYNPHVRYGAAMAIGVACAGQPCKEVFDVLEPLVYDVVDFVRQGAMLALAMVLIQSNKAQEPKVEWFRKKLDERITGKHEPTVSKFGAILAAGLLDAGGRNVTMQLCKASGHLNMTGVVGLTVFLQYWYWFPLLTFVSLSFTPTAVVVLNGDLQMPKMQYTSRARPSLYAYPPDIKPRTEQKAAVVKVELSTAAKTKKRQQDDKDKKEKEAAATAGSSSSSSTAASATAAATAPSAMDTDKPTTDGDATTKDGGAAQKKQPKQAEPESEKLQNPARVTPAQARVVEFAADDRYQPVRPFNGQPGFVIVRDTKPGEPQELVPRLGEKPPAAASGPTPATPASGGAKPSAAASTPAPTTAPTPGAPKKDGDGGSGSGGGGGDGEASAPDAFELPDD